MTLPWGETVTVLTPQTSVDPYSTTQTPDWTLPHAETEVEGVGVEPRPSTEPVLDARHSVVAGYTLYLPAGTTLTPGQRVRVRGTVYQVDGEPAVWQSPLTGWAPGVVVQCKNVEG